MIYHLAYLVFLGKLIAVPGVTKNQLSHLVACFVVQLLTNLDNELVQTRLCLLNLDLFLKKKSQWDDLVSGGIQFCRLCYPLGKVHIMQDTSGDSTLEAKEAFERDHMNWNFLPKHYHADNGRFAENIFKQYCESKMQNITFCGVGAHQQNDVSERIIKDLTLSSWNLVLNAKPYWP